MTSGGASSRRYLFSRCSTDIAATARIHSMIVVAGKMEPFATFGVNVLNPFSSK
jgi:hypothetical protein